MLFFIPDGEIKFRETKELFAPGKIKEATSEVGIIPISDFDGEYNPRNLFFMTILWTVSVIAMMTNITIITAIWIWKALIGKRTHWKKVLWDVGRSSWHRSSPFVDWFSKPNHDAKVFGSGCVALDIFYNFHTKILPKLKNNPEGWLTKFWIGGMENRQAVTNRRKIVSKLLVEAFHKFAGEGEIRMVSVASGSAQAVVDAFLAVPYLNIKARLLDIDDDAIKASRERIREAGLQDRIEVFKGRTSDLEKICEGFQPHIVEIVGFIDYRNDKGAIRLFKRIRKVLAPKGVMLTCNITPNREKIFLDWNLLWPMIYRTPERLRNILLDAGFEGTKLLSCPFRIHTLAVCVCNK
jgi:hypothetical protein